MGSQPNISLAQQQQLVEILGAKLGSMTANAEVEFMQTHISHVILVGDFAYKIKKPLDLGFLDFSTLERRKFCCEEELRLNRRLAPELYLDALPITGSPEEPEIGGMGPVIEYCVKMRRFSQQELFSTSPPDDAMIARLARTLADFHQGITPVPEASPYGHPEQVIQPMLDNFSQIRALGQAELNDPRLDTLELWTRHQASKLSELLVERKRLGHIRECHGDLHFGNITTFKGKLEIFDGIEFNPNLSWIDTLNDLAFLLMDLLFRNRGRQAAQLLNLYMELTGDYPALPLLRLYQLYRAMVRAKVAGIRFGQPGLDETSRQQILDEYQAYLSLAESLVQPSKPILFITHGLSGSGKSHLSGWLASELPAIRLRSDVERQRLFAGRSTAEKSGLNQGLYSPEITIKTYEHLRRTAAQLLQAGFSAIVDAAFLRLSQREPFQQLAADLRVPYLILDCQAPHNLLEKRLSLRASEGVDPSEADSKVLAMQIASQEQLTGSEAPHCFSLSTETEPSAELFDQLAGRVASLVSGAD